MALGLDQHNKHLAWVLPPQSAEEAALLPDARVYRAAHLRDVAQAFADLAQADEIEHAHVVQAMHFRMPLSP